MCGLHLLGARTASGFVHAHLKGPPWRSLGGSPRRPQSRHPLAEASWRPPPGETNRDAELVALVAFVERAQGALRNGLGVRCNGVVCGSASAVVEFARSWISGAGVRPRARMCLLGPELRQGGPARDSFERRGALQWRCAQLPASGGARRTTLRAGPHRPGARTRSVACTAQRFSWKRIAHPPSPSRIATRDKHRSTRRGAPPHRTPQIHHLTGT